MKTASRNKATIRGRLVTRERFALGRIPRGNPLTEERTVNAQIELFPNGDFGRLVVIPQSASVAGRGVSVEWQTARRRTRDGYDPWRLRLSGGTSEDLPMDAAGVFALRARTVCATQSNEVEYVHLEDEPHIAAIYDRRGPNRRGMRNHVGVASSDELLTLRNVALSHLDCPEYTYDLPWSPRSPFCSIRKEKWKCNIFIADIAIEAGLSVPVMHMVDRGHYAAPRFYPPLANDWASGSSRIAGWEHLGGEAYPEPGLICGRPNPHGMGHCGIVDYDGWVISARRNGVSRTATQMMDESCVYTKPQQGE